MYFDPPSLVVLWFVGALFLAGVGVVAGWMTARALQIPEPRTLWPDAVLSPLVYACIYVVAKPNLARIDWALIGSLVAPIAHQAVVRVARN